MSKVSLDLNEPAPRQELPETNESLAIDLEKIKREQIIDGIIEENIRRLEQYVLESDYDYDIGNIPEDVLQAFIPRKIYERSRDPKNVKIKKFGSPPDTLDMMIYEQPYPRKVKNKGSYGMVDSYKKDVGANARVYNTVELNVSSNKKVAEVSLYDDNSGTRGEGLSYQFYKNMEKCLKELGFRYIVGLNNEKNIDFFTRKLGRVLVKDLPIEEFNKYFKGFYRNWRKPNEYDTCLDLTRIKGFDHE